MKKAEYILKTGSFDMTPLGEIDRPRSQASPEISSKESLQPSPVCGPEP